MKRLITLFALLAGALCAQPTLPQNTSFPTFRTQLNAYLTWLNDNKSASNHTHAGVYAPISHVHLIADVTGLQAALDGKSATSHNHDSVYAALAHVHLIADITNLQTTLDGKAASSHNHDATYAPVAKGVTNGDTHDHSGGDGAQIAYSSLSGLPTLGDAAAKNTGTAAGTVAAGDHNHTGTYETADATIVKSAGTRTQGKQVTFDADGKAIASAYDVGAASGGADANGYYLVNRSTNAPTNAVNLGALATGFVKGTVSGGVASMTTQAPSAFSVIASGTAATIGSTAPAAALDFGTQDPTTTLTGAGSLPYWITYHVRPNLAAATFAAVQNVSCWLYRTNNTPGIVANTTRASLIPIVTTTTLELTSIYVGTMYASSGTNDVLELRCQLSAAAGAGSVTAVGASVEAMGLFQ